MTYQEILKNAEDKLNTAGDADYKADAWIIFSYIFNMDRMHFMMACLDYIDDEVDEELIDKYNEAVDKRIAGTPVQYITNEQNFYGYDFYVDENVLIPRQDTEIVVENVINTLQSYMLDKGITTIDSVLDMCTGSGCIAVTLSKELPIEHVYASDISDGALEVAKKNAAQLEANVDVIKSDVFSELVSLKGKLDAVVSNPPYIASDVIKGLDVQVKDHEPMLALDGSADGLKFYREITSEAPQYLKDGGYLFYEIGYDQGKDVAMIMKENGFTDVMVAKDLAGLDRVCYGHL